MNLYILEIQTHPAENQATLRLRDQQGKHLATQPVKINNEHAFEWMGLFNTREHVKLYADRLLPDKQQSLSEKELIAQLGVFLGREVLGAEIWQHLSTCIEQRTLLIRLPTTAEDHLAAAFARIPWEIARFEIEQEPLLKRNVAIRAITGTDLPEDKEITFKLEADETLRVLLIFAGAEIEDIDPGAVDVLLERLSLEGRQLLWMVTRALEPVPHLVLNGVWSGIGRLFAGTNSGRRGLVGFA